MKKMKTLSILLVFVMTLSLGSIVVSAAENEYWMCGGGAISNDSEAWINMLGSVENGSISSTWVAPNSLEMTFVPDTGYSLLSNMHERYPLFEVAGSKAVVEVIVNGDTVTYRTTIIHENATSYNTANGDYGKSIDLAEYDQRYGSVTGGAFINWIESTIEMLVAKVVYTDTPPEPVQPDPLYTVRVESNPAGIATFAGYGTGFSDGDTYNVSIASQDPAYVFIGWVGAASGTIAGSDVGITANFEQVVFEDEVTPEELDETVMYDVTAISQPAGVATFTGQGQFINGDSFRVEVATFMDGYEFVRWDTVNAGVMDGADVEVLAVFEEITEEELVVEEEPVVEPEEVLDEESLPEEQPEALPETSGIPLAGFVGLGSMISGLGLMIRRKK